jgi:hypothetical protein
MVVDIVVKAREAACVAAWILNCILLLLAAN